MLLLSGQYSACSWGSACAGGHEAHLELKLNNSWQVESNSSGMLEQAIRNTNIHPKPTLSQCSAFYTPWKLHKPHIVCWNGCSTAPVWALRFHPRAKPISLGWHSSEYSKLLPCRPLFILRADKNWSSLRDTTSDICPKIILCSAFAADGKTSTSVSLHKRSIRVYTWKSEVVCHHFTSIVSNFMWARIGKG